MDLLMKRDAKCINYMVFSSVWKMESWGRGTLRSLSEMNLQMVCPVNYTVIGNHDCPHGCIERHLEDWWVWHTSGHALEGLSEAI